MLVAIATFLALGCLPPAAAGLAVRDASRASQVEHVRQAAREDFPGLEREPRFLSVLKAMSAIDRRSFVPRASSSGAYGDDSVDIGFDQVISEPYCVALMTMFADVERGSRVLEVGTGSGYQAAVLSRLGADVHTIEIIPELAAIAARRLVRLGYGKVAARVGDGFAGWPEAGPYDAILVTAGSNSVPAPLLAQLGAGGRLVMPVGANAFVEQMLVLTKRADGSVERCSLGPVTAVPLAGRGGNRDVPGLYDRNVSLCRPGRTAGWFSAGAR